MAYNPELINRTCQIIEHYLSIRKWPFEKEAAGSYKLYQGSTFIVISVKQWGGNTLVSFRAPMALECTNLSGKVTRVLLEKNYDLILGKFSLNKNNQSIYYENSILGNDLTKEEFYSSVESAAIVADKYEDDIARISGGRRAMD